MNAKAMKLNLLIVKEDHKISSSDVKYLKYLKANLKKI